MLAKWAKKKKPISISVVAMETASTLQLPSDSFCLFVPELSLTVAYNEK